MVGTDFNPEIGFLRRDDFERSFGSFRFSPRPQSIAAIRKLSYGGRFDYITDRAGVLETRVTPQLSVEPSVVFNWVDLPQGGFTTQLLTKRTTYTVTPLMFVSALLQYNSSNDSLGANLRLRWEYQPGSELFVVYNEQRDTRISGYPALENRAFIIKY